MNVTSWSKWGNVGNLKVISDTYFPDEDIELQKELFNNAKVAVIKELKKHNYHFTGATHQEGEKGCPVLDYNYIFQVSCRTWGQIMADTYPQEDYKIFDEKDIEEGNAFGESRYIKWAWYCEDPYKYPGMEEFKNDNR